MVGRHEKVDPFPRAALGLNTGSIIGDYDAIDASQGALSYRGTVVQTIKAGHLNNFYVTGVPAIRCILESRNV